MKRTLIVTLAILMLMLSCFMAFSCKKDNGDDESDLLYTENTTLGTGDTTFTLVVEHFRDKTVTFTINTSKEILSDALLELGLITGHNSTYGLYIDSVNGVAHDFNTDGIYWAIYEGDQYASTGIDGITITNGATYKLIASR